MMALAADLPAIVAFVVLCVVFAWLGYRMGIAHRERCSRK